MKKFLSINTFPIGYHETPADRKAAWRVTYGCCDRFLTSDTCAKALLILFSSLVASKCYSRGKAFGQRLRILSDS